ncbi:MAG: helix-turn-helix domain-containing protein [Paracoccaceae bacterium]
MIAIEERIVPQTSGVLFKRTSFQHITLRQFVVVDPLTAPWLDHLWLVEWNLPSGKTYTQATLPYPTCHIILDRQEKSGLFGCSTGRFDYTLMGTGTVIGARLHPGAFRAFHTTSAHYLTNTNIPLAEILSAHELKAIKSATGVKAVKNFAGILQKTAAPLHDDIHETQKIVNTIRDSTTLFRVSDLQITLDISPRKLQRLFRELIGVSPKWVIDRFRMFDAVETISNHSGTNLADLAARLGYADQAHFSHIFKSITGVSPGKYANG